MAYKPSPNSLIHCAECGEDYSATYKKCPFCGAKNSPQQSASDSSDLDDTYVFDGQDLFDDKEEGEDYASAAPRGGKRLAEKPLYNPFANADINWPRVITFVCSLVIIVAAMIIVFTVIYPQLRGNPTTENSENPSSSVTDPVGNNTESADPSSAVTGPAASDPVTGPSASVAPSTPSGLTAISFSRATDADFTLNAGGSHTITLKFTPASWSGSVTWTSSNTQYATVDNNGKVTNVNTTSQLRSVTITASAGGLTLTSKVFCKGVSATEPSPSNTTPASDSPASQSPSGSGSVAGKTGTVVNASGGLNVRSGPGTSYKKIGSLSNGNPVTIVEEAANGWYKITYSGIGGATTEGYVLGTYISIK